MTWVLVILSASLLVADEIKTTNWALYETQNECLLERAVLTSTFTQGERAVCVQLEEM